MTTGGQHTEALARHPRATHTRFRRIVTDVDGLPNGLGRDRVSGNHAAFGLVSEERTTGLEPATFGLGSQRSTS